MRHPRHRHVRFVPRSACVITDGSAIARMGTITQGQGHQTTYAQIIASEAGIPASVIQVEEGDASTAPYGLGTYGSRSTPVAGAAVARAARKIREKARLIAAHLFEVGPDDVEFDLDRFALKGSPRTVQDLEGSRMGRLQQRAGRHGNGAGSGGLLRSAQLHLPVRRLRLRARYQPLLGRDAGAAASTRWMTAARASTR
ncbi:molybdopterin cofactor-binding domain-containing protein [Cupriavidus basilensis]